MTTCYGTLRTGENCPRQAVANEIFCLYHRTAIILNYDFQRAERFPEPATKRQRATIAKLSALYPKEATEIEIAINSYNKPGWYYKLAQATKGEATWIIYMLTNIESQRSNGS